MWVAKGAAVLAVSAAAFTPTTKIVKDASGDVANNPMDLVRVSLGRASNGELRASLTAAGAFSPKALLAKDGIPGTACLRMWTKTKAAARRPTISSARPPARPAGASRARSCRSARERRRSASVRPASAARPRTTSRFASASRSSAGRPRSTSPPRRSPAAVIASAARTPRPRTARSRGSACDEADPAHARAVCRSMSASQRAATTSLE